MEGDCAILQFPGDKGAATITMLATSQGGRILVEVDDNYVDQGDALWRSRSGWGAKIGQTPHTVQGHRWICEHASGVIVTTEALRKSYLEVNDNVYVCRNTIDPNDWPELKKPSDGIFRIGWYASRSHDRDGLMARKAMSWASRQPGVEIVNIGLDPSGWDFKRQQIGWRDDFLTLREELMRLDVGISPLVGTPMTKYRSDVKALEYAMAGALPVLQAYEPYAEWDDKPARRCWTEKDWLDEIKWCVKNQDGARELAAKAREYVLQERTFKQEIVKWREAVSSEHS